MAARTGQPLKLPNFVGVGAQRGGTTYLYNLLSQHPDVFIPKKKEIHFFDLAKREAAFSREIHQKDLRQKIENIAVRLDLAFYAKYFEGSEGFPRVGEITPDYMFFDWVPGVMARVLGEDTRYIMLLRNPIWRTYSHYWHEIYKGREHLTFEKALQCESERIDRSFLAYRHKCYVTKSLYASQIKRFFEVIRRDKTLIILSEDLFMDPEHCFGRLCDFLGIRHFPVSFDRESYHLRLPRWLRLVRLVGLLELISENKPFVWRVRKRINKFIRLLPHRDGSYPTMSTETREWLKRRFERPNAELSELLQVDLRRWS